MATLHTDGEVHVPPQSEIDKLGPLGTAASVLPGALRAAVMGELIGAAEAARDAAVTVDTDANDAVHSYRKALRRARAVLSLVRHALAKRERRAVEHALQEARRSVSAMRDHAVAPDALDEVTLDADARATATAVLVQAAAAQPSHAEIAQRLREGVARAVAQVEALEAALPRAIELDTLIRGVRDVYAAARKARRRAKSSTDPREFHRWRRRTKELVYQLQLLARWAGERTCALRDTFDEVGDALSEGVDLVMLGDFIATYGHGIATVRLAAVETAIAAQRDAAMAQARVASRGVFARRPKRFAAKLARAVRRDVEPAGVI
jgi:CHAD domain-containing protein